MMLIICLSAPYVYFAALLCGDHSSFLTVHIFHSFSVRCTFIFLHRTYSLRLSYTVRIYFPAPHKSSTILLCGAYSTSYTAHIFYSSSVRCSLIFSHRTNPPLHFYAVFISLFAPYIFSTAFLCGAYSSSCTAHIFYSISIQCS